MAAQIVPFLFIIMLVVLVVWFAMLAAFVDGRRRGRIEAARDAFQRSSVERAQIYREGFNHGVASVRPFA